MPDYIKILYEEWYNLSYFYPPKINIEIDYNSTYSSYDSAAATMNISGVVNNDLFSPDIFDNSVIAHEYGHHLSSSYNFFRASAGGSHEWDENNTPGLAAAEGFSTFFSCYVNNSPEYRNYNNLNEYEWVNCESGEFGNTTSPGVGSANNYGDNCEGAVAGILWDIYDSNDDDYSTFNVFPYPYGSLPDGIGDYLYDGTSNILEVLLYRYVDGEQPDNITDFWVAWNQYPSLGNYFKVRNIFYEHGVYLQCCVGTTGNADNDPNDIVNIADLTFLIDFLFHNGLSPVCMEEANIDNSEDVIPNISDVTYFIEYLFNNGPVLPTCRISKNAVDGYAGN